jgi:hypothetical protein
MAVWVSRLIQAICSSGEPRQKRSHYSHHQDIGG